LHGIAKVAGLVQKVDELPVVAEDHEFLVVESVEARDPLLNRFFHFVARDCHNHQAIQLILAQDKLDRLHLGRDDNLALLDPRSGELFLQIEYHVNEQCKQN
jgi:hypothetical protein